MQLVRECACLDRENRAAGELLEEREKIVQTVEALEDARASRDKHGSPVLHS